MKQLLLMTMSTIALMVGMSRSTHAQARLVEFAPASIEKTTQLRIQETTPPKPVTKTAAIFPPSPSASNPEPVSPPVSVPSTNDEDDRLVAMVPDELFAGGSNSLVAKAVGSAEGTRTPDGGKTWAYYGHVDPGNGRWNLGSFSYQHGASSPEEADQRQLDRLRRQFEVIRQQADAAIGLRLGLEAQLNGIDLANQAPLAALDRGGYIDRLRQAQDQGLKGSKAVLYARTYSYLNPVTNQWDAPGLGNNLDSITQDQARRQSAIAQAITIHTKRNQR